MAKITKTKSGKYHAYVYLGRDKSGARIIKSITDADRRVVEREIDRLGRMRGKEHAMLSFTDMADAYVDSRQAVLSPSTIREYKSTIRMLKTRYGAFCALTAHDISKSDIQGVINSLYTGGASPKRVRNVYGVIGAVLRHNDISVPKPALPESIRPDLHEPTRDDIRKILDAVGGTPLEIPVRLGIHGLRLGEICALDYPADFGDGFVHINKSLAQAADYSYVIKAPKNITSNRTVPIDNSLLAMIKKQGYVTDLTVRTISKRFAAMIKANNLPHIRFHDLRHFFASYMHEQGFSDAQIMKIGGWSTDNVMKRVYRYAMDNEESNRKIARLLTDI